MRGGFPSTAAKAEINCMNRNRDLAKEDLECLLNWLDKDRPAAEQCYLDLHRRLTTFFANRGCANAEDLADKTFNRATRSLQNRQTDFEGEPARYLFKIAQNLLLEVVKERQRHDSLSEETAIWLAPPSTEEQEREAECLDECLQTLSANQRELILQYYQAEKRSKIDQRRQLAEKLGITPVALRLRVLRLRELLETCLERRLNAKP